MDILKIENIKAGYDNKIILDDISFSLNQGELTALLGLNGAGKTTLLKTISGLIKPISGKCIIKDVDCFSFDEKQRARHISFMPQRNSIIYNTKVIDVVLMGITPYLGMFASPTKEHKKLAYDILKKMSMEKYAYANFLQLSEGQKQLVIICRSLMQNAEIMLFDEPDSALDYNNRHMMLSCIRDLINKERRVGLITLHDPNYALNYCDKIIFLEDGKILAEFDTKDVDNIFLHKMFTRIYGKIDIIRHREKYVMVRLDA